MKAGAAGFCSMMAWLSLTVALLGVESSQLSADQGRKRNLKLFHFEWTSNAHPPESLNRRRWLRFSIINNPLSSPAIIMKMAKPAEELNSPCYKQSTQKAIKQRIKTRMKVCSHLARDRTKSGIYNLQ